MTIIVYCDGLCEPINPGGIATAGIVIFKDNIVIHEAARFVAEGFGASSNAAEYAGVNAALEWLLEYGMQGESIEMRSDSMLVVNQMAGRWESRGGLYISQYRKALGLAREFSSLRFRWIPREQNALADALSRKAYENHCKSRGTSAIYPDRRPGNVSSPGNAGKSCMNCKWMKARGPHVGCFLNGKYRKWISRAAVSTSTCEHHAGIGS